MNDPDANTWFVVVGCRGESVRIAHGTVEVNELLSSCWTARIDSCHDTEKECRERCLELELTQ